MAIAKELIDPSIKLEEQFMGSLEWDLKKAEKIPLKTQHVYVTDGQENQKTCMGLGDGTCLFYSSDFQTGCNQFECTGAGKNF